MLVLPKPLWERVVAHCLDGFPLEACGLLAGTSPATGAGRRRPAGHPQCAGALTEGPTRDEAAQHPDELGSSLPAEVKEVFPSGNAARSARLYTVEPKDLLAADRAAERAGWSLIGVWHSHTHTPAYPSPTDVGAAPDPAWHYVLVSLADSEPVLRSYLIAEGEVEEEPVMVPVL